MRVADVIIYGCEVSISCDARFKAAPVFVGSLGGVQLSIDILQVSSSAIAQVAPLTIS